MKMKKLKFVKLVASGNDFILPESAPKTGLPRLARKLCDRKFGIGADGMLILEPSKKADVRMRIFNADGSEAEMCGNGCRSVVHYLGRKSVSVETKAGIIEGRLAKGVVSIRLTDPRGLIEEVPLNIRGRILKATFIDTGVPHTVIFAEGLEAIRVLDLGRMVRNHENFSPKGTNVDFIEPLSNNAIRVRTYERGVEDETLACGTGSVAAALVFALKTDFHGPVAVHTRSGEVLKVYFRKQADLFRDVWLEGRATLVFRGVF
jgi:diaminopimelate epimerase